MGSLSIGHWLIVLAIIVLVFGTRKLRNIGADLGGAVQGFKRGMKEGSVDEAADPAATPQAIGGKYIEHAVTEKSNSAAAG